MNAPSNAPAGAPADDLFRVLAPHHVAVEWPEQVRAYLAKHPELVAHVLPTVARARREFGDAAGLTLTINDDPEFYDPYLKLYVRLPEYGPDTMGRIEKLRESLSEATADLEGYFLVTTDHCRTRG